MYRTASTGRCVHDRGLTSQRTINKEPTTKNPRSCVRVVYMASDTLRHQPMGASHMTMLQLRGPIRSCVLPWWLFIAVDTLCQHPMRTGHMTVLQSCGLMEFRVLQWCHPMPARAEGGQAVVPGSLPCMVRESGFRPAQSLGCSRSLLALPNCLYTSSGRSC